MAAELCCHCGGLVYSARTDTTANHRLRVALSEVRRSGAIDVAVSRVAPAEIQFVPLRAFQRFPLVKGTGAVRRGGWHG